MFTPALTRELGLNLFHCLLLDYINAMDGHSFQNYDRVHAGFSAVCMNTCSHTLRMEFNKPIYYINTSVLSGFLPLRKSRYFHM